MTPLPPPLGGGEIRFWRLDAERHAATWASGEGAFRVGGRWNSPGRRTVYAALDPATAVLEVAVHKGFQVLDTQPHRLTHARILDASWVHVVRPDAVPNPHWLNPGTPNSNQQRFGDDLTRAHRFVLIPSVVPRHSWNLIFDAAAGADGFTDVQTERFALDPRLQA